MLMQAAIIIATKGVRLSPNARKKAERTLYPRMIGIPAKIIRRYKRALSKTFAGVSSRIRTGRERLKLRMVNTTATAAVSKMDMAAVFRSPW